MRRLGLLGAMIAISGSLPPLHPKPIRAVTKPKPEPGEDDAERIRAAEAKRQRRQARNLRLASRKEERWWP